MTSAVEKYFDWAVELEGGEVHEVSGVLYVTGAEILIKSENDEVNFWAPASKVLAVVRVDHKSAAEARQAEHKVRTVLDTKVECDCFGH